MKKIILFLIFIFTFTGCSKDSGAQQSIYKNERIYTFVWIPDNYHNMKNWIKDNTKKLNIQHVFQSGEDTMKNKNHYELKKLGNTEYIFLTINTKPESVLWANNVLKGYPKRKAILLVDNYMKEDGTLTEFGQNIFDSVVVNNPNLLLILCGRGYGSHVRTDEIEGRKVYQILSDYEDEQNGENGYLKIFTVDETVPEILVETYSPHIEDYSAVKNSLLNKESFIINIFQDTH